MPTPSVSKSIKKPVNPIQVSQKVVDAVHVLQDNGLNVETIETQLVDSAVEDLRNGNLTIEGMTETEAMASMAQCCPGMG